jgi:hypothetical protein
MKFLKGLSLEPTLLSYEPSNQLLADKQRAALSSKVRKQTTRSFRPLAKVASFPGPQRQTYTSKMTVLLRASGAAVGKAALAEKQPPKKEEKAGSAARNAKPSGKLRSIVRNAKPFGRQDRGGMFRRAAAQLRWTMAESRAKDAAALSAAESTLKLTDDSEALDALALKRSWWAGSADAEAMETAGRELTPTTRAHWLHALVDDVVGGGGWWRWQRQRQGGLLLSRSAKAVHTDVQQVHTHPATVISLNLPTYLPTCQPAGFIIPGSLSL